GQRRQGRRLALLLEGHLQGRQLAARGVDRHVDRAALSHGGWSVEGDDRRGLTAGPDPRAGGAENDEEQEKAQGLLHIRTIVLAAAVWLTGQKGPCYTWKFPDLPVSSRGQD